MHDFIRSIKRTIKKQYIGILQLYYNSTGSKVECNICHFKANKFDSNRWHLNSICPNCDSRVRARLLFASLTYLNEFSLDKIIKDKKVLHFAPENSARKLIQEKAKYYKTADFADGDYKYDNIDYNIDISDMKEIKDESFDCVIACDVLEHVERDKDGIKEVHRVLTNDGYCIFTVPQKDDLAITYEDHSITDSRERERAFGQSDHWRIYGDDFIDMLQAAGFEVTSVDEYFFDKAIVDRFVLAPPVLSKHPLATNYRKVFFGKKR